MFVWYIDLNNLNSLAEIKKASSILLSSLFHLNTYSSESVWLFLFVYLPFLKFVK